MRTVFSLVLSSTLCLLLSCTTSRVGFTVDPGTIGIDFTFQRQNMCFGPSPQLILSNLPDGTRNLNVTLRDLDHPIANHGGGYLKDFKGTVVAAGALEQYEGPCPSMGDPFRPHYVFKVEALDASGKVIATGQAMKQCGWSDFE